MQAGIIGLGLMGGSLGLALKETKMFKSVVGYDESLLHGRQALTLGLVDELVSLKDLQECDIVYVAVPLESTLEVLKHFENVERPNFTIVDLGSVKDKIAKSLSPKLQKYYIGAHPMCGTENSGPSASVKDLYKHKIAILTNLDKASAFQEAFAKEIFLAIGMQIVSMDSVSHDKHVAFISHLPHVLSFALVNAVLSQEKPEDILMLAGGGFVSMSRLSKSSPVTWSDIFKQNKDFLTKSVNVFEKELAKLKGFLEKDDYEGLKAWISNANNISNFL
ncbi:prephenate dehydrogenase [Helicobacter sp. 11S02629-2]|uniref:prephenate dehydrogenase n=1 Tax=Helicobacter sp. 11S02629-2 TaxID=1476195 RepID=UPI000BA70822|nr:prephenate dehydrogenase [Helicobacter sp. 11S02629-2]PAF45672.1 prephenate dehydrogenase [Helicobacter sp. 11S02629-2]